MQYQLTHSVLARYCSVFNVINLSQSTLSLWENNKRTPTVDNLQFVADIFAVNLDWLLGRSDEKYSESVIKILEPSSFPLTVTVCDTTVDVPIELPDDYKNYEIRQQTYSLAARADIIFCSISLSMNGNGMSEIEFMNLLIKMTLKSKLKPIKYFIIF